MRKTGRCIAAGLLAILFLCLVPGTIFAAALEQNSENSTLIRIGICPTGGGAPFHRDEAGLSYFESYLNRLAYYAKLKKGLNLTFTYSTAASDQELVKMAAGGKIDLMEMALHEDMVWYEDDNIKEEGEEEVGVVQLTGHAVGEALYSLCTQKNDKNLLYEDWTQMDGLNIGALENSPGIVMMERHAEEQGFSYHLKTYSEKSELEQAVETGEISAAITDLGSEKLCRVVAHLGQMQLYLVSSGKKETPALKLVRELQEALYSYEPHYNSKLAQQYFSGQSDLFEAFTQEENDFIRKGGAVRLAICVDGGPNLYYDEKSDGYKGTYFEIQKLLSAHSGLTFTYVPANTWDACLSLVKDGQADAVLGVYALDAVAEEWELDFSDPLLSSYIAVIGESGGSSTQEPMQVVALTQNNSLEWGAYVQQYFPNWEKKFYSSEKDCLQAVADRRVGFALIDGNSLQARRFYEKYQNISVITSLSQEIDVSLGISKRAPDLLQRVLNKSVKMLSKSEIISCQMNNAASYEISMWDFVSENWVVILGAAFFVGTAFAFLFITAEHKKRFAEQKSAFFSNMSHEIRTPLNGILGMTAIAKKNLNHPQRLDDCLNKIDDSGKHLLTIVNDILDFSKLEKKKMEIALEQFSLCELLRSVHTLYYNQARAGGVCYDTVIKGVEPEFLMGDYTRLSQVLMNLLSNAVKFTPSGKCARLIVEQLGKTPKAVTLRFAVCDEGIGIPKGNLSKIFSAYEQQGAKTAGKYGGSGLGLPISKELVGLMGGALSVESELGKGSEFSFVLTFPLALPEQEALPALPPIQAAVLDDRFETAGYLSQLLGLLQVPNEQISSLEALQSWGESHHFGEPCVCFYHLQENPPSKSMLKRCQKSFPAGLRFVAYSSADYSELCEMLSQMEIDAFLEVPFFLSQVHGLLSSPQQASDEPEGAEPQTPSFSGKHVLIAEDNEINLEIMCELVRATGCLTDTAVNGEQALKRFFSSPVGSYDLIFMDIQMPLCNGYEASEKIRALPRADAGRVKIVAMTADAFAEDIQKARDAGMDRHLSKPVNIPVLYETMRELFTE